MKMKRLYVVLFLVLGMTMPGYCLTAAKKPGTMAELAMYRDADRQQILEEGARKEGKLMFYTTGSFQTFVGPIIEAFKKKYPFIKVDVWRTSNAPLMSRATEEFKAGKHTMDVVEGTQSTMVVMQQVGIVQPFISPNLAQIEDEAKTNATGGGALAVAFRSSGIGFGYNTKMLSKDQLPKTYQDLLDPKWRGKLAIAGSTGVNWLSAIYRNLGEDLLKKIAAQNFPVQMVSAVALVEIVAAGEYVASPTLIDATVYVSKLKGATVAWVPLEPVRVLTGQIAVAKHAPNPHAALLFADFEISKEGGEILRGLGYGSFREDVAPVGQHYKKYFGIDTMEAVREEQDLFNKLFLKK